SNAPATGYISQCYNNKPYSQNAAGGDSVTVTGGSATPDIDASVAVGGAVAGTVTSDTADEGVADVEVEVYDLGGHRLGDGYTDDDGTYTVVGIPAGQMYVCFDASFASGSSPSGYFSECHDGRDGVPWNGWDDPSSIGAVTVDIDAGA